MTLKMMIATAAWLLLMVGFLKRKNRRLHVSCMMSGIIIDLLLVIYLQVTSSAVQTAAKMDLGLFPMIHIAASLLAVVFFVPTLYFGIKLLKGGSTEKYRLTHIRVAIPALVFRTIGFVFMFSMMK